MALVRLWRNAGLIYLPSSSPNLFARTPARLELHRQIHTAKHQKGLQAGQSNANRNIPNLWVEGGASASCRVARQCNCHVIFGDPLLVEPGASQSVVEASHQPGNNNTTSTLPLLEYLASQESLRLNLDSALPMIYRFHQKQDPEHAGAFKDSRRRKAPCGSRVRASSAPRGSALAR